jgi:hypothetical protein
VVEILLTDWRRAVVVTHRWLGIVGCLLFGAWFASGIVMMYSRMPRLEPAERLARLAPLDLSTLAISPGDVVARDRLAPERFRVAMLLGRPVYRVVGRARSTTIFADSGERLDALTQEQAVAEARRFAPEHAGTLRYDARLADPDQWTLQNRGDLPLHRIALGDADDTYLYLAERSGEVVVQTDARARRIAYAGAVLHWIYFTPFRRNGVLWAQSIIWLSIAGSVMCLLGLVWGFYTGLRSPYRGWLRWHHYAGLAFGVVSFTWIFSGLLSMDPWDWHPSTSPTRAQREAFAGGPLRVAALTVDDLRAAAVVAARPGAKELEAVQFKGTTRWVVDGRAGAPIDRDALMAAACEAVPNVEVADAMMLEQYDSYYYDRAGELPLPVLRVRFADAQGTWLYIDPRRGSVARVEARLSRVNRWLYHGLHSLDFPFLYRRRPLWDIVVISLSLGGIASVATSLAPAWRRLRRHAHRLYS